MNPTAVAINKKVVDVSIRTFVVDKACISSPLSSFVFDLETVQNKGSE
jgi:hypothetical protein